MNESKPSEPLLPSSAASSRTYKSVSSDPEAQGGVGGIAFSNVCVEVTIKKKESKSKSTKTTPNKSSTNTKPTKRLLLDNVSGVAMAGETLALMGPSGSGKTTLLSTLAGLRAPTSGSVAYSSNTNGIAAYVPQENILFDVLTVRETLQFGAQLRLPRSMSAADKQSRVEAVMEELQLTHTADTRVGGGLSGGEKKRLSVALELLQPDVKVLLCDEATSGLDSATSLQVVRTLQRLARNGRVVVLSIHQPRAAAFLLFDSTLVLSKGRVAFSGKPASVFPYVSSLGYDVPDMTNPADHLLDLLAESPTALTDRYTASDQAATASRQALSMLDDGSSSQPRLSTVSDTTVAGWLFKLSVLFRRSVLSIMRNPVLSRARVGQTVFVALLCGLLYFQVKQDETGIQNRAGAMTSITMISVFSAMSALRLFAEERKLCRFEFKIGLYKPLQYFLGKTLAEAPLTVALAVLFATVTQFMIQFRMSHFVGYVTVVVLVYLIGESYAIAVGSLIPNDRAAALIAPLFLVLCLLFGGLFVSLSSVPSALGWIGHISLFRYSFAALMTNELKGMAGPFCGGSSPSDGPSCPFPNGDAALASFHLGDLSFYENVGVLCVFFVVFRFLGFFGLWWHDRAGKDV